MVSQFLVCGRNENLQTRLEKKKSLDWYHTRKMTGLELLCMHWCLKCYSVVLFFRDLITKILKKKGKTFTSPICSGTVTCAPLRLRLWLPIFIDAHFWHVGLTFFFASALLQSYWVYTADSSVVSREDFLLVLAKLQTLLISASFYSDGQGNYQTR